MKTSPDEPQANIQEPFQTPIPGERLDHIARLILERHYPDELDVTGEVCDEQEGIGHSSRVEPDQPGPH